MSIRIGIYDFFAYTIPGGLMLCIVLGVLDTCGFQEIWAKLFDLNTLQIFLLIIGCYLTGIAINPVLSKWSQLFEPENFEQDVLNRFKKRNPTLPVEINATDWAIWLASIRRESMEMGFEIDRFLAIAKMIRGASIFLLFSGILALINVFIARISAWYLPLVAVLVAFSVITVRESIKFKRWFYLVIYETVVSRQKPFSSKPEKESAPKKSEK